MGNVLTTEETSAENETIENIPYNGFNLIGMANIYKSLTEGLVWYQSRLDENAGNDGNRVFQVKLEDWRIIVGDADAVKFIFDDNLVERIDGFGTLRFNENVMNNHRPSEFSNGEEHKRKKNFLIDFLKQGHLSDIIPYVQSLFEKLPSITSETQNTEFESLLTSIAFDTVFHALHGETFPELDSIQRWSDRSLQFVYAPSFIGMEDDKALYDGIVKHFMNMNSFNVVKELAPKHSLAVDEAVAVVIWTTIFNACAGVKSLFISAFAGYARLTENDKLLLKGEASSWFQGEKTFEQLSKLKFLDCFVTECLRLYSPAPVTVKAKKNFLLETAKHKYQVYEGNKLTANPGLLNRDPKYFKDPYSFDMHRAYSDNNEELKRTIITFAGYFGEESHSGNHKCLGQNLTVTLLKLLTLHLTQCQFEVISDLAFTGTKFGTRLIAVDEELQVKQFRYAKPE